MANGEWGIYRGAVNLNNPEDIQHWKYTKKYWAGGKWRYVYDDVNPVNDVGDALAKIENAYYDSRDARNAARKKDSTKTAASKNTSSRNYNSYVKSVENTSVSTIVNDKIKPWKEKANKFFDRLKIEAKSLANLLSKWHEKSVEKRIERKKYGVTTKDEFKNQIDYATHPSQWKQPYKSAATKKKEEYAAKEAEYRKKHPIYSILVPKKNLWR